VFIALGKATNELMRPRGRPLLLLALGYVRLAVSDIVSYRIVEQNGVLRHDSDLRAQRIKRHFAHVMIINQKAAPLASKKRG